MNTKRKIINIIENENKKNTYSDKEISDIANVTRAEVIKIRNEFGIKNSRERRDKVLIHEIEKIVLDNPKISERNLTSIVNEKGFNVSRTIVSKLHKFIKTSYSKSSSLDISKQNLDSKKKASAFSRLIGFDGSLKNQVELAKAAILYPPKGLHTLICGPSGSGKSEFAQCMYQFSKESNMEKINSNMIIFNCADYADNPQLLLAQLFGYVKGAYTGAETDKEGIVEKANNGILFLDEIHRLPPEGQEILFTIIDKGKYRRLGESSIMRKTNLMIIGATTENIESSLLTTFRRRIPVLINLSPLKERPIVEKIEIIKSFFQKESNRINKSIEVSYEVINALILYDSNGNIGELRSNIQVTCARAFLNFMRTEGKVINIFMNHLPSSIVMNLLKSRRDKEKLRNMNTENIRFMPGNEIHQSKNDMSHLMPDEIYKEIEDNYKKMKSQGIDDEIITKIIQDKMQLNVTRFIRQFKIDKYSIMSQDLYKIVDKKMINIVNEMLRIADIDIDNIGNSLLYCLSVHMSTAYKRVMNDEIIINHNLEKVKNEYEKEYLIAQKMISTAEFYLGVKFPQDEIAFIAMYLRAYSNENAIDDNHVQIVVMTHGHVAGEMLKVANRLLGVKYGNSIEMSLDEDTDETLKRTINLIKCMKCEKGVLFMADMGMLENFGTIISDTLGIKTRTVTRIDTLMVVEGIRRALMHDSDLDEIADYLNESRTITKNLSNINYLDNKKENVIVSLCLTGEGNARYVTKVINNNFKDIGDNFKVLTVGVLTSNFDRVIGDILSQYRVICMIGTINPGINGVPFIKSSDIINGKSLERLRKLINISTIENVKPRRKFTFEKLICEDAIILNSNADSKNAVIKEVCNLLYESGYVNQKFIASVFERENMAPTSFKNGIALPHGTPENTIKSVIGIITLKNKIKWSNEFYVDVVFVLALNNYNKNDFLKFYSIIDNTEVINKIKKCKNKSQLKEVILDEERV